jgi:nicotinamide riboside kinase
MHVHFCGAQITGKSELVQILGKRWGCETRAETAREELVRMGVDLLHLRKNLEKMNEYQWSIFHRQSQKEYESPKWCVFDRCALDNVAYAAEYASMVADLIESVDFRKYVEYIRNAKIFFLRPQRSYLSGADDGTRKNLSWDSVVRIDGMVKFIFESMRVPYIPIDTPSMQERVILVESCVGNMDYIKGEIEKERFVDKISD